MARKGGDHTAGGRYAWRKLVLVTAAIAALTACGTSPKRPQATPGVVAPDNNATAVASQQQAPAVASVQSVVDDAVALTGTPYRYGGANPESGFDCSGLVWYVYGRHGVRLPRVAARMASALPEVGRETRRIGDLLFFNTRGSRWSHVAIYIGNDRFVHAPSARTGRVIVSSLNRPYWRRRLTGVRRPLPAVES